MLENYWRTACYSALIATNLTVLPNFTGQVTAAENNNSIVCNRTYMEKKLPSFGSVCEKRINDLSISSEERMKAIYFRGIWFLEATRFAQAEADLSVFVKHKPKHTLAILNLAVAIYYGRKDRDEAVRLLGLVISQDPKLPTPHNILGRIAEDDGERRSAISHYSSAIELNPNYGEAVFDRAQLYLFAGRFKEALAGFDVIRSFDDEKLSKQPTRPVYFQQVPMKLAAHIKYARILRKLNRFESAEIVFNALVKDEPSAVTYTSRAEFLKMMPVGGVLKDRSAEAMRDIKLALAFENTFPDAHFQYAHMLRYAQQLNQALTEIDVAIKQTTRAHQYPKMLWERAMILKWMKKVDDATASGKAAVQVAAQTTPYFFAALVERLSERGFYSVSDSNSLEPLMLAVEACMIDEGCN